MRRAKEWLESGRTLVVRYERLHSDPIEELRPVTDRSSRCRTSASPPRWRAAAPTTCARWVVERSKHVRAAKVGDSREKLNDEHLAVFREKYADMIRALGYEVR